MLIPMLTLLISVLASMALAPMADTLSTEILGQQPPLTLVTVLLPLGLGALLMLILPHYPKGSSSSSSLKLPANPTKSVARSATGRRTPVFCLLPQNDPTPFLFAKEDQLDWFCAAMQQVKDLRYGTAMAVSNAAQEELPDWTAKDFKSAFVKLRMRICADLWPNGGRLHEPLDDIALAQRLMTTELDVDMAVKLVHEYASFRQDVTHGGGVAPPLEWIESGTVFVPCEDILGRPVINIRPRYHRRGNPDLFKAGLRSTVDALKAHYMRRRGTTFSETNPLEQYVMVFDFAGYSMRNNLDWDAFHVTVHEGAVHYPNMGSQIYVLNVSAPLRWLWTAASKFMQPRVRRKCILVAPGDVPSCMSRLIASDQLPPVWGGTGPAWPGPEEARTLEDQVGPLLANTYRCAGVVPAGAKPSREDLAPSSIAMSPEKSRGTLSAKPRFCVSCFSCLPWHTCRGSRAGPAAAKPAATAKSGFL